MTRLLISMAESASAQALPTASELQEAKAWACAEMEPFLSEVRAAGF